MVAPRVGQTFVPVLRRDAGLLTADTDEDAHSHLFAVELGIPAIVGTFEGMDTLRGGMRVALDAKRGVIYERPETLIHVGE